jgi:hypothetical protein
LQLSWGCYGERCCCWLPLWNRGRMHNLRKPNSLALQRDASTLFEGIPAPLVWSERCDTGCKDSVETGDRECSKPAEVQLWAKG